MNSNLPLAVFGASLALVFITGCCSNPHSHSFTHDKLTPRALHAKRDYCYEQGVSGEKGNLAVEIEGYGRIPKSAEWLESDIYGYNLNISGVKAGEKRVVSLYNLAVQGRKFGGKMITWDSAVKVLRQGASGHLEPLTPKVVSVGAASIYLWEIEKTGTKHMSIFPNPNPPKQKNIMFLEFTGETCAFIYASHRMWHSRGEETENISCPEVTIDGNHGSLIKQIFAGSEPRFGIRNGHDTTPPETEGGGENGDQSAR